MPSFNPDLPFRLNDGTDVELVDRTPEHLYVRLPKWHPFYFNPMDGVRVFKLDGTRRATDYYLENIPMFDPTKPIRTRDGRSARIVATDYKDTRPIVALVNYGGEEFIETYYSDGQQKLSQELPTDLVNVPEQRVVYANLFRPADARTGYNDDPSDLLRDDLPAIKLTFEDEKLVNSEVYRS